MAAAGGGRRGLRNCGGNGGHHGSAQAAAGTARVAGEAHVAVAAVTQLDGCSAIQLVELQPMMTPAAPATKYCTPRPRPSAATAAAGEPGADEFQRQDVDRPSDGAATGSAATVAV